MLENEIIGKTIAELEEKIKYRVVSRDGKVFMVTADYVSERYNLSIKNDKVVSFTKG